MNTEQFEYMVDMFKHPQVVFANKALDFYDGKQLTHMVETLSDSCTGRRDWQSRGMKAMYRNVTASIIDKSTMLFNRGRPQMIAEDESGEEIEEATFKLNEHFDKGNFDEFLSNFDAVVRLLKTALIHVQYDNEYECFTFDILHRGNCTVETMGPKREVSAICYITGHTDKGTMYRTIDMERVQDWYMKHESGDVELLNDEENLYGCVPVSVFYDAKSPRDGFWNYIPQDLVQFNVEYNLYLTDTVFAASFANRKSLFTNMEIMGQDEVSYERFPESKLPRQTMTSAGVIAGPDRIIEVDSSGVENPMIEFKGPDIKLTEIREMFDALTRDIASDWGVRIKTDGEGSANSGFQVVVEEMDNLELRSKRQQNFEGGLSRLYYKMVKMLNVAEAKEVMPELSIPHIEFAAPALPYEEEKKDTMWIGRIDNGLASRVDYIQSQYNISREEAEAMLVRIDEDNAKTPSVLPDVIE